MSYSIEFDPIKDAANRKKHGLSLSVFSDMELENALIRQDTRRDYGEQRFVAMAPVDGRLCVAVFTMTGDKFRVISLRKANDRERKKYNEQF